MSAKSEQLRAAIERVHQQYDPRTPIVNIRQVLALLSPTWPDGSKRTPADAPTTPR